MISVIVRTKNEEKWIDRCIKGILMQNIKDVEIIVVDNASTDRTLEIVGNYNCKVVSISDKEFTFGRSLNVGINEAEGKYIAIISGHCIPANDRWLYRLWRNFHDENVAGVYGKQEPLRDSSSLDKRDLLTVFGFERRVQEKDYFFHNANSMIRKGLWTIIPFDEELSGVEDRDWAKKVIEMGYKIVYDPYASVYHHHGLHHSSDVKRADRVVKVIELINNGKSKIPTGRWNDNEEKYSSYHTGAWRV
ncbi:MAG: glycosyltransferase [Nitrospirae bacterium]|nr:glycosyltransferase [Nitrospirota bacterium]